MVIKKNYYKYVQYFLSVCRETGIGNGNHSSTFPGYLKREKGIYSTLVRGGKYGLRTNRTINTTIGERRDGHRTKPNPQNHQYNHWCEGEMVTEPTKPSIQPLMKGGMITEPTKPTEPSIQPLVRGGMVTEPTKPLEPSIQPWMRGGMVTEPTEPAIQLLIGGGNGHRSNKTHKINVSFSVKCSVGFVRIFSDLLQILSGYCFIYYRFYQNIV